MLIDVNLSNFTYGNAAEIWDPDLCIVVCPRLWLDYCTQYCQKLMNSVGSNDSLSLPFVDDDDDGDGLIL